MPEPAGPRSGGRRRAHQVLPARRPHRPARRPERPSTRRRAVGGVARPGSRGVDRPRPRGRADMGARLTDSAEYAHLWGTDEVRATFDQDARRQRWLDILVALAYAQ